MIQQEYFERIQEILNEASGDKELSIKEYSDLCEMVSGEATDRYNAAQEEQIIDDIEDMEQEDKDDLYKGV